MRHLNHLTATFTAAAIVVGLCGTATAQTADPDRWLTRP
jgi:hypothetical protein